MPPTLADRLEHILAAIDDVQLLLSNSSADDFAKDKYRRVAVERFFEIISEASRHILDDKRRYKPRSIGAEWPISEIGCDTHIT
jgi:uncharacterized protein with HEPN domain